jgi:hypothetical protein
MPLVVLGGTSFAPGRYMIHVGSSNPDGKTVLSWNSFGPFDLQGNDKWAAYLLPQARLRLEKNPAALLPYAGPGPAGAMIYARNTDISSWQSICVLPVGMPVQSNCFGSNVLSTRDTFSRWTSITPDQRQYAKQPGGLFPLGVVSDPNFVVGQYMIYVANSDPAGQAVSSWNSFGPFELQSNDKWAAYLLPQARLRLERNSAVTLPYSDPGANRAMIYARNTDSKSWQSICVLPVGMTVQPDCFGGSGNVVLAFLPPGGGTVPPTGIDGVYVGTLTWGTFKLYIHAGEVVGSMTGKTGFMCARVDSSTGTQSFDGKIRGQVSNDGRITASISGRQWVECHDPQMSQEERIKVANDNSFAVQGEMTGCVGCNAAEPGSASGVMRVRGTSTPMMPEAPDIKFDWSAKR